VRPHAFCILVDLCWYWVCVYFPARIARSGTGVKRGLFQFFNFAFDTAPHGVSLYPHDAYDPSSFISPLHSHILYVYSTLCLVVGTGWIGALLGLRWFLLDFGKEAPSRVCVSTATNWTRIETRDGIGLGKSETEKFGFCLYFQLADMEQVGSRGQLRAFSASTTVRMIVTMENP